MAGAFWVAVFQWFTLNRGFPIGILSMQRFSNTRRILNSFIPVCVVLQGFNASR